MVREPRLAVFASGYPWRESTCTKLLAVFHVARLLLLNRNWSDPEVESSIENGVVVCCANCTICRIVAFTLVRA